MKYKNFTYQSIDGKLFRTFGKFKVPINGTLEQEWRRTLGPLQVSDTDPDDERDNDWCNKNCFNNVRQEEF